MIANYHTHTTRCQHAIGDDRSYVEAAIRAGIQILGFSDHCPWIFPTSYTSPIRMASREFEHYVKSIYSLKEEYKHDITIYCGLESEYVPELQAGQQRLLASYPIDYMILGQHYLGCEYSSTYTGAPTTEESILRTYVDQVIAALNTGNYLYVAHPDLIHFTGSDDIYEKHMLRLCNYFTTHNYPVEINMLGVQDNRHYTSDRFLRIAKEANTSAIIGIDAHSPDRLEDKALYERGLALAAKHGLSVVHELPIEKNNIRLSI